MCIRESSFVLIDASFELNQSVSFWLRSVNEAFSADGFVEAARFFALLIANADEADL